MQHVAAIKLTTATDDINCNVHVYIPWPGLELVTLFNVLNTATLVQPVYTQTEAVSSWSTQPSVAPFGTHVLSSACRHHVQPMSVSKSARGYATNNPNSGYIRQNSKYVYVCRENKQQWASNMQLVAVCSISIMLRSVARPSSRRFV
jgi:hypothetical protein